MRKKFELPQEIKSLLTIKNFKDGFGHDLAGFYCDIYLDKKKVGYVNDDGWGGETDIQISKDAKKTISELFKKHKIAHLMLTEGGWDFMKSEDKIDFNCQLEEVINIIDQYCQIQKIEKRLLKDQEKAICYGFDATQYSKVSWRAPLKGLMQVGMRPRIQEYIDTKIKPQLEEGQTILNTNFEELGLIK